MTRSTPSGPIGYRHVDVFSPVPYGGNSLAVFPDASGLTASQMAAITRELRHFESIFLETNGTIRARVFDLAGELDFAGHPVLGAASVLHAISDESAPFDSRQGEPKTWTIALNARTVEVRTERVVHDDSQGGTLRYRAVLDQGAPTFLGTVTELRAEFAAALGLSPDALHPTLPLEVVSTGLRYLVVPLASGLAEAHIARRDFEALLATVGAEFAYVLDVHDSARLEGRHWNNDGIVEDVATGSGAGCVAAYGARHGLFSPAREVVLRQGRFVGRPSEIRIRAEGLPADITRVLVGGDVALVGRGTIDSLPPM